MSHHAIAGACGMNADENNLALQAAGDTTAFTMLYQQWFPRVFNYILYRSPRAEDAEDLAMLVFEKLLKSLHSFDPQKGPFGAWLFAIARNVLNDHLRLRKFTWLPLSSLSEQPGSRRSVEDICTWSEDQKQLLEALAALSDRERDILGLKFAARLNNRQIAAQTGLSESSVGVIIFRSLRKLRKQLERDPEFAGDGMESEEV
jgi:RNA polymerase sigma-70 factor (ECF subfamily)